jgi:hypothetical protein
MFNTLIFLLLHIAKIWLSGENTRVLFKLHFE